MQISVLTEKDEKAYTEFLLRHDQTSMVASLLFRDFLLSLTHPSIPYYFIAKEGGDIVGALPAFMKKGKYGAVLNSLPWFGSNPGVIVDDDDVAVSLVEAFIKTAEWTNCLSVTLIASPFDSYEWAYELAFEDALTDRRVGTITELPEFVDAEDFTIKLMSKFHSKTRNQVRKSYNECYAGFCSNEYPLVDNAMLDFLMETHRENMEVVGGPVKSKEFSIIGNWCIGKDVDLYVSRQKETGHQTAALLVAYFNKTVDYWVPAINVNFRHLNPLHILIFEAMKNAAKRGFKYWNWGGTTIPGMEDLLHFKQRFGGQTSIYKYYTKMSKPLPHGVTKEYWKKEYPYFFIAPFSKIGGH